MPLTAIRWIRPGSSYHGVVHYVDSDLVHNVEGKPGRVVVHWPKGSKVVLWKGERVKSGKAKRHLAVRLPPSKAGRSVAKKRVWDDDDDSETAAAVAGRSGTVAKKRILLDSDDETDDSDIPQDDSDDPQDDSDVPQATPGGMAGSGGSTSKLDNQATLPELLTFPKKDRRVSIPQEIGVNYQKFGILLLKDNDGRKIDAIIEGKETVEEINLEILKRWLQGDGLQPGTWRTLIQVLQDSNLNTLAEHIEDIISPDVFVIGYRD